MPRMPASSSDPWSSGSPPARRRRARTLGRNTTRPRRGPWWLGYPTSSRPASHRKSRARPPGAGPVTLNLARRVWPLEQSTPGSTLDQPEAGRTRLSLSVPRINLVYPLPSSQPILRQSGGRWPPFPGPATRNRPLGDGDLQTSVEPRLPVCPATPRACQRWSHRVRPARRRCFRPRRDGTSEGSQKGPPRSISTRLSSPFRSLAR